ncbi:NUDIX hydrolase [Glycomyces tritici]|uniref:NUDIX hydrolase n=1 Tax=Glycomyces tritici TaxID=2665176 RepID=A0ABT7YVJ8_9ACTN|nr:NUDIX hydrolase [Glycomyces tritici]MDN3242675.1 NUDIX hydrolase [Glycomyces tritici]
MTTNPTADSEPERSEAIGLARIADMIRAEAANGLYWGCEPEEEVRLRALRDHAAALLAEVDHRPYEEIREIFAADGKLRTPIPGTEFRIDCGDGTRLVHRRRFRSDTLAQRLETTAAALGADVPAEPVAIADTDLGDLPCPHTYLLVYEFTTGLDADAAEKLLEPADPDLDGDLPTFAPAESAVVRERGPLRVSPAAKAILAEIADIAMASLATATSPYSVERHHRVAAHCARTVEADLTYPRIDCGDLAAFMVSTGADAAVFDDEGRLLVIKRTDTGQWAVPGGGAEVGEPVALAAIREAFEETGLEVALTGLSWAFDKRDTNLGDSRMPMIMSFTAARTRPGQAIRLAPLEASDHRWMTEAEAAEADLFKGHELRIPVAFAHDKTEQ